MSSLSMIDNIRIDEIEEIITPKQLLKKFPLEDFIINSISGYRNTLSNIIHQKDHRLAVYDGPCSIHNPKEALEYARELAELQKEFPNLFIIFRAYGEKIRTKMVDAWLGLINDPDLDGSCNIEKGIEVMVEFLDELNRMPIPVAVEYLDVFTPQYFSNRVTGGAIGARTTESQEHRKMASGISGPIAFKNATNGNIDAAINAILSAQRGHTFLAITDEGHAAKVKTTGNLDTYILLRGGTTYEQRNYDKESITKVIERLIEEKITTGVGIDFSHGHSINPETGKKEAKQQLVVCENVSRQIADGNTKIVAAMIETNKNGKAYKHIPGKTPVSKIPEHTSITDEGLDSPDNRKALSMLNKAVEKRMKNI